MAESGSPMRIVLVSPRGFCAGVRMAIDVVDQLLELCPDEPIYVYHEIVHNTHVVGRFRDRGVAFVDDVAGVPEGAIVVFSAHGIPPSVRDAAAARGLRAIDATCPLVTKVHMEAIRYARQGYQILLIGHREHQEVIGTFGEAPGATQVVESPADIAGLTIHDEDKLVYLTQTTLSTDDAAVVIDALKARFPNIKAPPGEDICYATTNRQHAVRQLAPGCDLCIVVGSTTSSNSKRLTEISENAGCPARLVDDASQMDEAWFEGVAVGGRVLLTAGASAPEDLVAGVCRWMVGRFAAQIELGDVDEEDVDFALPVRLRKLMEERGVDPKGKRISVEPPRVTAEVYGAVPLTIGASG